MLFYEIRRSTYNEDKQNKYKFVIVFNSLSTRLPKNLIIEQMNLKNF